MYVPDTVRLRFEWKKIGSEAGRRLRRLFELRSNCMRSIHQREGAVKKAPETVKAYGRVSVGLLLW